MVNENFVLSVKLSTKVINAVTWYEGTISLPGLSCAKISRRSDGKTQFANKSALSSAAKSFARSIGYADAQFAIVESKAKPKKVVEKMPLVQVVNKVAAKKSV